LSSGLWAFAPAVLASSLYGVDTISADASRRPAQPTGRRYRTRDGREIYLAGVQTERHFENFCAVIERPDLLDDPRFATGCRPTRARRRVHRRTRRRVRPARLVGVADPPA